MYNMKLLIKNIKIYSLSYMIDLWLLNKENLSIYIEIYFIFNIKI